MKELKKIELENNKIVFDIKQLAETEEARLSVITSMFIRTNNEMRLRNIQDIKEDISYGAKNFRLLPKKYLLDMDFIIKSYIEETNKFMKAYNEEFKNIQNILKYAEEKQKYYFFKIREAIVMKKLCLLAGKQECDCIEIDKDIIEYNKKISLYEKVILRCDKQFEICKLRRKQEFKELFEINQTQELAIVKRNNFIFNILRNIKNIFNGYKLFYNCVLKKYFSKLNVIKTGLIDEYLIKEKQNKLDFSNEIKIMLVNE